MRMRFDFPDPEPATPRGGAPVGYLREMSALEQAAILCLRGWCDSTAKGHIANSFRLSMGPDAAEDAIADLDALMSTAVGAARRPLMRHDLTCRCVGGDECAFAQLMAAAAQQDREEATLFACTLMRGPAAFEVVRLAGSFGPALMRMAHTPATGLSSPSPSAFKH